MADNAPTQHEHVPPHGPLIEKLNDFRLFCGDPSLGDIERTSKQLTARYGDRYGAARTLPPATVSAVLAGKRKKPPKRPWLVAFVLTCEWYAWKEAGVQTEWGTGAPRTGPPVPERVLAPWIQEHQAVLAASRARSRSSDEAAAGAAERPAASAEPARRISARPSNTTRPFSGASVETARGPQALQRPDGPPHGGDGHAAETPRGDRLLPVPDQPRSPYGSFRDITGTTAMREPIKTQPPKPAPVTPRQDRSVPALVPAPAASPEQPVLDASQTRIRAEFGLLGLQLYDRAEEGHVEAAFRLGVLLCANQSLSEGMFYIGKAKDCRHGGAAALGRVLDRGRLRQRALDTVYGFARDAHTDNELRTAVSYCVIAARNDHADSTHMLATLLIGMGQGELADLYQRHAARLGHAAARAHIAPASMDNASRSVIRYSLTELLSSIVPESRFDRANATQPIDMVALFATMDAEELAENVQRIPLTKATKQEAAARPAGVS